MTEKRPDPDKLLERVQAEERQEMLGKLKIYLGAAPGVGKTYTMLHDAQEERAKGLDIIIGVAESHGRVEIEEILKKFEILPRITIDYHGRQLQEFDLDGALKRHPALIIIDEMAHTNPPACRHKKRWQDIKELLERGIDIYTTLNVQHIESISDDVAQIIRAPIKETVPDEMLEIATAIELVDIPPEALLERLKEGKVYIPKQAELATERYFRKGNLSALRELALRTTANLVSVKVLSYRQDQGIEHIWPTHEKILVCVGPDPESVRLLRAIRRMASRLQAEWIAVYVNTPRIKPQQENYRMATKNLQAAERLGAQTVVLTGTDVVKEIMSFARNQNITRIAIWKNIRNRWRNLFFRSLADEIVRHSGEIDVYIMTGHREKSELPHEKNLKQKFSWKAYGFSIATIAIATFINYFLSPYFNETSLAMVYLLSVVVVALMGRMGPAIFASLLSVFIYGYLFLPPRYEFDFFHIGYFVTLIVMLIVSQIITHLTLLTRQQMEAARFTSHQTLALYQLSRQLASTRGIDKLIEVGIRYIADVFNSDVLILLPQKNHLEIRASYKRDTKLDEKEYSIAQWVYEMGEKAGLGTDTLSFSEALYLPLLGAQSVIGVLRVHPKQLDSLSLPEKIHNLEACANQIALAIEVDRLHEKTKKSELELETDRIRNTLLKSLSQDLRAPVVAIMGTASTQIEKADTLNVHIIQKLGKDIYLEAEQLNRLINNILQISYLESGQVTLQKELLSLKELVNVVVEASQSKLEKRLLSLHIPDNLPLIPIDGALLQEVLKNLIDNTVKFTPVDSPIEISVELENKSVIVKILDRGPGIVPDEVNKLFEKFYRGRMIRESRGLGLGLAICQRIIRAHGGKIWAENAKEGGAIFIFTLPL